MKFDEVYKGKNVHIKQKYLEMAEQFRTHFNGTAEVDRGTVPAACPRWFSAPASAAVSGELTVPQCGKTISAALTADVIAAAEATNDKTILIVREDDTEFYLDFGTDNENSAYGEAIIYAAYIDSIKRVLRTFTDNGLKIGGFRAVVHSRISPDLPLDGCAAFSVLISVILIEFYNKGICNRAKLMSSLAVRFPKNAVDRAASLSGGFVAADFKDAPVMQRVILPDDAAKFYICIINANYGDSLPSSHDAAVYEDMKTICEYFAVDNLRHLSSEDICLNMTELRAAAGDRAILRALYYFDENDRTDSITYDIEAGNTVSLFELINAAGGSLYKYLRPWFQVEEIYRPIVMGMCVAENELGVKGALRVYFGKYASCQVFVPAELIKDFKVHIERVFGLNTCRVFGIRNEGACEVELDFEQARRDVETAVISKRSAVSELGDMID